MVDTLTPAERSELMARVRSKDTRPEILVRRLVHAMGYRYRLHVRRLPGSPDLVFPRLRKVLFVHGCFWHQHPNLECKIARLPKSRPEFWRPKLEGNRRRDKRQQEALLDLGWRFMVVWECETWDIPGLIEKIQMFLAEDE
ncbi:very short patch repair endonuclease [Methylomagnum ishizawai]|uniref:very short patch repair endonuclease n=1 Tax=Methylomagnum ishizawai TaxID=1760988 RepID=UPI001C33E1EA|nr:very short patch repair endonuclease [Methylomagnum ishizawai]BBL73238.1 very short patch repair endonuclease [Methylomagnum ishizawai]